MTSLEIGISFPICTIVEIRLSEMLQEKRIFSFNRSIISIISPTLFVSIIVQFLSSFKLVHFSYYNTIIYYNLFRWHHQFIS